MKKYQVSMSKSFYVKANDETEAEEKAIELCAGDPECLMPHNMEIEISGASEVAEVFFDAE